MLSRMGLHAFLPSLFLALPIVQKERIPMQDPRTQGSVPHASSLPLCLSPSLLFRRCLHPAYLIGILLGLEELGDVVAGDSDALVRAPFPRLPVEVEL